MKKIFVIVLLWLGLFEFGHSRHIIGGDFSYTCLGVDLAKNQFTISCTLKVYRDCFGGGALYDNPATIGIYRIDAPNRYVFISAEDVALRNAIKLANTNPCIIVPGTVCVEEGTYIFRKTLPISNNSYYINYQRCCRNETISNIILPGDQGASYFMEITPEAQRTCNNSPKFKSFPPILICEGFPLNYDHSITDPEGDLVTYEFCNPFTAGGKAGSPEGRPGGSALDCDGVTPDPLRCPPPFNFVQFRAPTYTRTAPMGGNPVVSIDPVTGIITGTPNSFGQYVVAVCIKEYRNGILLSVTQRDFQFNVINCTKNLNAIVMADSVDAVGQYVINSCGKNNLTILNQSSIASNIRTYDWTFNINGQTQTFNTKDVSLQFPGLGVYTGKMVLNKADKECSDSADITIKILPDINADFRFAYDTCIAGPVFFTDQSKSDAGSITQWNWDFETNRNGNIQHPTHEYKTPGSKNVKLVVEDMNKCRDSIVKNINYYPVPALIVVEPSSFIGCFPLNVFFNNLSYPIDHTYKIEWDFGDGSESGEISPNHEFTRAGIYNVQLKITSPLGCKTENIFNNLIEVLETPKAAFSYSPNKLSSDDRRVQIQDQSLRAEAVRYFINDRIPLLNANPTFEFQDTGVYKLTQIVNRFNGCTDTAIAYLDVEPLLTYFMPNAFTPNGDGENERFFGVGFTEYMKDFEILVWDRWGAKIFESKDPQIGWNGKIQNEGADVPPGVYVYQVRYLKPRGEKVSEKGFVNLIR